MLNTNNIIERYVINVILNVYNIRLCFLSFNIILVFFVLFSSKSECVCLLDKAKTPSYQVMQFVHENHLRHTDYLLVVINPVSTDLTDNSPLTLTASNAST
jgi:hypothetical protein